MSTKDKILRYETVEAFLRESQEGSSGARSTWRADERRSVRGEASFTGTKNYGEALRLARAGWPEGRSRMVRGVEALASTPSLARAGAYALDVAGAFPLAALAAAGDPACMVTLDPVEQRRRPVVRIAVGGSYSHWYTEEEVFNAGIALLALVDSLEDAGVRVELNVVFGLEKEGERVSISVLAKAAEDALDLDRAAFLLAHASTLRRLVFGVMERHLSPKWSSGYGRPRTPERGLDGDEDVVFLAGVQQFKAGSHHLASPRAALDGLLPAASAALRDRYADFPPLQFGDALAA